MNKDYSAIDKCYSVAIDILVFRSTAMGFQYLHGKSNLLIHAAEGMG